MGGHLDLREDNRGQWHNELDSSRNLENRCQAQPLSPLAFPRDMAAFSGTGATYSSWAWGWGWIGVWGRCHPDGSEKPSPVSKSDHIRPRTPQPSLI